MQNPHNGPEVIETLLIKKDQSFFLARDMKKIFETFILKVQETICKKSSRIVTSNKQQIKHADVNS